MPSSPSFAPPLRRPSHRRRPPPPSRPSSPRSLAAALLSPILLSTLARADRSFVFINKCPETIWPAITTYSGPAYTGVRGWEAEPNSQTTQTVPDTWNGRTWARRGCNSDGTSCVSGGVAGGIQPTDGLFGNVNIGEFNLDTTLDYWDISAVPGFNLPVTVQPSGSCTGVVCSSDINPTCPDSRMQEKAPNGVIIGCLSACMAGIDAGTNSINCCSGTYDSRTACLQTQVTYYDYFKQGCTHAYAFPFDDDSTNPAVVYTCANPATYTITFCPDGLNSTYTTAASGSQAASSSTAAALAVAVSPTSSSKASPVATGTTSVAAKGTSTPVSSASAAAGTDTSTPTSASAGSSDSATSDPAVASTGGAGTEIASTSSPVSTTPAAAAGSTGGTGTASASAESATISSSSILTNKVLGVEAWIWIVGGLFLLVLLGVGAALLLGGGKKKRADADQEVNGTDSDTDSNSAGSSSDSSASSTSSSTSSASSRKRRAKKG